MSNAIIYINGNEVYKRPYGYSSFSVDITNHVKKGENLLAVYCRPLPLSSRWYSGAGIYRNVRLVQKSDIYLPFMPVFVYADVSGSDAKVTCVTKIVNDNKKYTAKFTITDANGNEVDTIEVKDTTAAEIEQSISIKNFKRWHIYEGYLYNCTVEIFLNNSLADTYTTTFGVRTLKFHKDTGFFLNGENVKVKGVCLHHDEGALGAIVSIPALERKIQKLIDMGTNAVRSSHNPPSTEFLDVCDRKGILVMDEAFDNWKMQKTDNNYGLDFDKWVETDLSDMVVRDRNHPSIFMWSIGNEILEQHDKDGAQVGKFLNDIVKKLDTTRPTTAGFNAPAGGFKNGLCFEVDLVGINYKPFLYEEFHKDFPDCILYGSETSSCVSSRGEYYSPANTEHVDYVSKNGYACKLPNRETIRDNRHSSSYDNEGMNWSCPPDREFLAQKKYPFIFGEFVWTGFDYLGEPSPYRLEWPSRSSYFGIIDLAGIEKDRFYSYKSFWNETEDTLHLLPHWNWNNDDIVDVHAYSNYDQVELFLNGKSLGISTKDPDHPYKNHRHIWSNVPFQAGEIKAVATLNPELVAVVKTASYPTNILLEPKKASITADGDDLLYIRCTAIDENGTPCPTANFRLDFAAYGACEYLAADNGDPTDLRTFSKPYCNLFNGKAMIILRSLKDKTGEIKVTVTSDYTATEIVVSSAT